MFWRRMVPRFSMSKVQPYVCSRMKIRKCCSWEQWNGMSIRRIFLFSLCLMWRDGLNRKSNGMYRHFLCASMRHLGGCGMKMLHVFFSQYLVLFCRLSALIEAVIPYRPAVIFLLSMAFLRYVSFMKRMVDSKCFIKETYRRNAIDNKKITA